MSLFFSIQRLSALIPNKQCVDLFFPSFVWIRLYPKPVSNAACAIIALGILNLSAFAASTACGYSTFTNSWESQNAASLKTVV